MAYIYRYWHYCYTSPRFTVNHSMWHTHTDPYIIVTQYYLVLQSTAVLGTYMLMLTVLLHTPVSFIVYQDRWCEHTDTCVVK